jgi:phosphohistidine phosphatase
MELYLMRHGQAVPESENPEQPLSREGVAQIQASAAAMKRLGITPDVIVCSPKRRAHQTAALVAEGVNYPYSDILETAAVSPNAPAAEALHYLRRLPPSRVVLIAGHLPSLGEIASTLLAGGAAVPIHFDNGCLCRIDLEELPTAAAELRYHLPGALLRALEGV